MVDWSLRVKKFPPIPNPLVGEIWIDRDPRQPLEKRRIEVLAAPFDGTVLIKHLHNGKRRRVKLLRFDGKNHGYMRESPEPSAP